MDLILKGNAPLAKYLNAKLVKYHFRHAQYVNSHMFPIKMEQLVFVQSALALMDREGVQLARLITVLNVKTLEMPHAKNASPHILFQKINLFV